MYYEVKFGPEVTIHHVMVVFGAHHKHWLNWLVDKVEWTTPKYGHQN